MFVSRAMQLSDPPDWLLVLLALLALCVFVFAVSRLFAARPRVTREVDRSVSSGTLARPVPAGEHLIPDPGAGAARVSRTVLERETQVPAAGSVGLRFVSGAFRDMTVSVSIAETTVYVGKNVMGQDDIRLEDEQVAPVHAAFTWREDGLQLIDQGSTFGTWLDDVKLVPRRSYGVHPGQLVRFGRVEAHVVAVTEEIAGGMHNMRPR